MILKTVSFIKKPINKDLGIGQEVEKLLACCPKGTRHGFGCSDKESTYFDSFREEY